MEDPGTRKTFGKLPANTIVQCINQILHSNFDEEVIKKPNPQIIQTIYVEILKGLDIDTGNLNMVRLYN